jgi:DNA polymerase III subunit gamma/tau
MAGDAPGAAAADLANSGAPTPSTRPTPPVALYRRYRPATFAELKGQDHVTEPLRQALRSGRVHHAYLFSGPRGCGKTSSARILARSLNCEQGPTPDPCGKCASCVALAPSGPGSIDVIEIDAASHGGVDDARDLRERAFYAPVSGRFKIYIVDEAHMVTREGFNALLKLVEEPPPHLKFVFATTEPEKVIPTIRSRTHHYPFRLMPPAVLRGLLEEVLASEAVRYDPAVLPVVVRAGAGSARDALSVLDQLLAGSDDSGLTYERAVVLLGYTDESLLDEVAEAFGSGDGAAVFRAVDRVIEGGHDPRRFAADLLDRFRDLIVLAAVPDAGQTGLLDVPADRLDRMREQAASFGQAQLARAAEIMNAGLSQMRGATSPRLQLELICAQVLLPPSAAGDKDLLARVEQLERRLAAGAGAAGLAGRAPGQGDSAARRVTPARAAASSPAVTADAPRPAQPGPPSRPEPAAGGAQAADAASGRPAGGTATPDADLIRERWPDILEAVRHRSTVAWTQLIDATVDTLQEGILTLRFAHVGTATGFSARRTDEDLGQVLEKMLGLRPKIRAIADTAPGGTAVAGLEGRPLRGGGGPGPGSGEPGPAGGQDEPGPAPAGETAAGRKGARAEDSVLNATVRPTPAGNAAVASGTNARTAQPDAGQAGPTPVAQADPEGPGHDPDASALSGVDLIQRALGGQVIEEIGDA